MSNITPIILILASVGLFFGYINPTYTGVTGADTAGKSIKELQSEEKDYSDALNKTAEIERVRTGLSDQFRKIALSDQIKLEKLLPDHIDSVRLIIDINNIAAKYGMSLTNIVLTATGVVPTAPKSSTGAAASPQSAATQSLAQTFVGPDDRQYDSIKLGFTVTGTYENFIQLLKEIEESLRVVDVTSLAFAAAKPGASSLGQTGSVSAAPVSSLYTFAMTIRTYYLK